ncbi:IclR family transcriptional regulator [Natronomonas gomsonensis]|uniref:IclR family transcriptional regulator n=1 Tax=Natronomonas gomsonensis TaxID=1046043 RepID=UPI0020CA71E6|nr:IclR family transcriptional regulator [Natronomonas gomsonensis]MCY4731607.1 IclR family transcriptional regulator [Natronomonas gomsonensis]
MGTTNDTKRTVKAAETTFTILETLKRHDGMRLTELASELGMAKSTVHRYLQTLLQKQYLVKDANMYHVSLRFLDLGEYARNRQEGYQMAKQKVEEVAEETQERAQFIVEEHGQAVYVHRKAGTHAVQTDPGIGKRIDLHSTSAGKAIIAEWSDEEIQAFVDHWGLPSRTSHTITDFETLMETVDDIRDCGYAVNRQENIEGLCAIGVSICGPDDEVIGALSVSAPTNRMKGDWFEQELPDMLLGITNEIELNIRYS